MASAPARTAVRLRAPIGLERAALAARAGLGIRRRPGVRGLARGGRCRARARRSRRRRSAHPRRWLLGPLHGLLTAPDHRDRAAALRHGGGARRRRSRRGRWPGPRPRAAARGCCSPRSALAQAILVLGPPLPLTDVFNYELYGRMAAAARAEPLPRPADRRRARPGLRAGQLASPAQSVRPAVHMALRGAGRVRRPRLAVGVEGRRGAVRRGDRGPGGRDRRAAGRLPPARDRGLRPESAAAHRRGRRPAQRRPGDVVPGGGGVVPGPRP